jgi:hypothetical protein
MFHIRCASLFGGTGAASQWEFAITQPSSRGSRFCGRCLWLPGLLSVRRTQFRFSFNEWISCCDTCTIMLLLSIVACTCLGMLAESTLLQETEPQQHCELPHEPPHNPLHLTQLQRRCSRQHLTSACTRTDDRRLVQHRVWQHAVESSMQQLRSLLCSKTM